MINLKILCVGHKIKTAGGVIKTVFDIRKIFSLKRGFKYELITQIDAPIRQGDERPCVYEQYAENGDSMRFNDSDNSIVEIVGLEQVAL